MRWLVPSRTAFITLALGFLASHAAAQAWLPARGEGTVSMLYQNTLVKDHVLSDGTRVDVGHIESNGALFDFTYGVTDTWAVSANLPWLESKYIGAFPHAGAAIDDGAYHGGAQDLRVDVRYGLAKGRTALAPFVGVIVPTHDYPYFGHASRGRRLAELQLGAFAGHAFDTRLPGVFVQARYSYGFVQRELGIRHDRSNVDLEAGYFLTPRLRVLGMMSGQVTHGGLELFLGFRGLTPAQFRRHDQLARANVLDVGGGAQLSVGRSTDVFVSVVTTALGQNGHALSHGITVGVSRSFGQRDPASAPAASRRHRALPKCLCQKGK